MLKFKNTFVKAGIRVYRHFINLKIQPLLKDLCQKTRAHSKGNVPFEDALIDLAPWALVWCTDSNPANKAPTTMVLRKTKNNNFGTDL